MCVCQTCKRQTPLDLVEKAKFLVIRDLDIWGQPSFFVYQESFSYLRAGSGAAYAVAVTLLSGILITVYVVVLRKRERSS